MTSGYHGCYLRIDLSAQTIERCPLPEETLRKFIGGVGLGTWLLLQETSPQLNAYASESPLIFALSPLVGTPLTTSAKFAVITKSPLTNRLNDALSSSHFAIAAKKTGCDAIVIVGACREHSILIIDNGTLRIEPANDLWGCTISETAKRLKFALGPRFHTAIIGPAGENGVRYATISHDNRHAGRGGSGSVMGAKKLKAIAVAGDQRLPLANPEQVVTLSRKLSEKSFGPATAKYRELGTVTNLLTFNRFHTLPTRNFQSGSFELAEELSEEMFHDAHRVARKSCAACTIGCEHIYQPDSDGAEVRLEYETLFALGPLCGIHDRSLILECAHLCDEFGMDTISTGATIAFAMECAERGLIDELELRFGNGPKLKAIIQDIVHQRGLGKLLAEGSRRAAEVIGMDAPDFAPHVKGLELPGYEPRTLQTMALGFAVGSRGADHNRSGAYEVDFSHGVDRLHGEEANVVHAIETEDRSALLDSLILCKFLRGVFDDLFEESAELLNTVTDWDYTGTELRKVSQRIVTMKRLYNIREGWTSEEDTLPKRFLQEGLNVEAQKITLPRERLQQLILSYYRQRGWNDDGSVPKSLVCSLGLPFSGE